MRVSDRFDRQITNLTSMMTWFGLHRAALDPELVGTVVRVCLDCPSSEACHDWLAQAATSLPHTPTFCPNARVFEQRRPPYFRPWALPSLYCEGSSRDLGWEGRMDDPRQPKQIRCPVCGVEMKPEINAYEFYEFEDKEGIFWGSVPNHYPGKRPEYY
jgi:hypothetical protein